MTIDLLSKALKTLLETIEQKHHKRIVDAFSECLFDYDDGDVVDMFKPSLGISEIADAAIVKAAEEQGLDDELIDELRGNIA